MCGVLCICLNFKMYLSKLQIVFSTKGGVSRPPPTVTTTFSCLWTSFALNLLHLSSPQPPIHAVGKFSSEICLLKHAHNKVVSQKRLMSKCKNAISTLCVPHVAAIRVEGDGTSPPFNFPKPSWLRHPHIIIIVNIIIRLIIHSISQNPPDFAIPTLSSLPRSCDAV